MGQSVCSVWTPMTPWLGTTRVTAALERKCVWKDTKTATLTALSVYCTRTAVSAFDVECCTSYACLF